MQTNLTPFAELQARTFLWRALLTFIASLIIVVILFRDESAEKRSAVMFLLLYAIFFFFCLPVLSRARISYQRLLGRCPPWATLKNYTFLAVPLVIFSVASGYLLYFPLSYLVPQFVQAWFLESPPLLIVGQGYEVVLTNLLNFSTTALVAPVFEEFFYRGILLTRWTIKWGIRRAILASSLVFALPHPDLIGAFFFGYVMAALYIQTKNLFVPICVHIANNVIALAIGLTATLLSASDSPETLAEFQASWWLGLIAIVIITPWAIWFTKRYFPKATWQVPYFAEEV